MKFCKIKDCNKIYRACGYCSTHYYHFAKYGDPLKYRISKAGFSSIEKICEYCKEKFYSLICQKRKFCSGKCYNLSKKGKRHFAWNKGKSYNAGKEHPLWQGGRTKNKKGYIRVRCEGHPNALFWGHYVQEHRLIMEKQIGRYLHTWEVVHHINKNPSDNRIENLMLLKNKSEHSKIHQPKKCGLVSICSICKKSKRIVSLKYNCCSNCYHQKLEYLQSKVLER